MVSWRICHLLGLYRCFGGGSYGLLSHFHFYWTAWFWPFVFFYTFLLVFIFISLPFLLVFVSLPLTVVANQSWRDLDAGTWRSQLFLSVGSYAFDAF